MPRPDRRGPPPPAPPPPGAPPRPPITPIDLGLGKPIDIPPGVGDGAGIGTPVDVGIPGPAPSASPFDPVGARPRGNQGKWVTNDDYRPRWIMEELSGTARFTLSIDARGQVTGCTITRSTGHAPLDGATCALVSKRARFDAARDGNGKPVAGSYAGSVTWQIPR
ncbi:MAG: TonB family protein [Porphyrobacter sp.]|nr:TonB family protein [Porphyrobacter sp.]